MEVFRVRKYRIGDGTVVLDAFGIVVVIGDTVTARIKADTADVFTVTMNILYHNTLMSQP